MASSAPFKPLAKSDVAEVLSVSVRTVENWVNEGTLPAPVKLGNRVYWHPAKFYTWLDTRLSGEAGTTVRCEDAGVQLGKTRPGNVNPAREELDRLRRRSQAALGALVD